ncbi:trypsin-like peptidase [Paraburkholderia sp. GV068]|uniref:S1 family peptidase n=1 Tax=unclassified Paraburkholderia TaxID=2615204 RepID=UPI000D4CF6CE|nr:MULTISPECIES: serine protease [unclassified Paraburkholderia]PTQ98443.1 trypsin-like peptidase [Paraburkholderia sp. GV072]PUB03686.1 trypsin-like peptidase [Paraburkholderia sp. GV068]
MNRQQVLGLTIWCATLATSTVADAQDRQTDAPGRLMPLESPVSVPKPGSVKNDAGQVVVFGTAFFYNDAGDMFTNRHVVEKCNPGTIRVRIYSGAWLRAKIIAESDRYDLAALSTKHHTDVFGAIRVTGDGHVLTPDGIEDIFSAGFSSPLERHFKVTPTWGQVEPWGNPQKPPYIQRMRMAAYPGASGSAVLDYAGLVVGVLFAGSVAPAVDPQNLRSIGYGDKWIYLYNTNAVVSFANANNLHLSASSRWQRQDPSFIMGHAAAISGLVMCEYH